MGDVNTETAPVAKNQIFGDAEIQYQKAKADQHKVAVEAREGFRGALGAPFVVILSLCLILLCINFWSMMMGKNVAKKLPSECNKCSDGGWLLCTILLGMISGMMIRMMFLKYIKGKYYDENNMNFLPNGEDGNEPGKVNKDAAQKTLLMFMVGMCSLGVACIALKHTDTDGDMFLL